MICSAQNIVLLLCSPVHHVRPRPAPSLDHSPRCVLVQSYV